ncbi:hypothetical protein [uncultured Pontibacter sp.]|nr:hypothetical protein [uncultured Pontibacter sp.]
MEKLHSLDLNSYKESGTFRPMAAIASRMFSVSIALVNFVDKDRLQKHE